MACPSGGSPVAVGWNLLTSGSSHAPDALLAHVFLGAAYGFGHGQPVEEAGVHHDAFLGIEAFFAHVAPFNQRDDGQVEVAGKGVVAAVVCGHGHDGPRAVTGQHVVTHPHGYLLAAQRVDGIRTGEHARHLLVGLAFAFGALFGGFEVGLHGGTLFGAGERVHVVAFGREHHERYAEHRVGPRGEDVHLHVRPFYLEPHFRPFAAAYPVALRLLERVGPVNRFQPVEQALGVGGHAQAPLPHLALLHRVAPAFGHAVHHLVVGQHRAQLRAPVHHRVGQVGDAVVHQRFLPLAFGHGLPLRRTERPFFRAGHVQPRAALCLEALHQLRNGACLLPVVAVVGVEHLDECPLRPLVIGGVAGAHLAAPVEREAYLVQLLAVAADVLLGGDGGVLPRLYGILLGGQPVGVVAHGVQHVEAFQAFVAAVDVGGDVAQRMPHVQPRARGVGEHVQHVILGAVGAYAGLVRTMLLPVALPLLLDILEVVFHNLSI